MYVMGIDPTDTNTATEGAAYILGTLGAVATMPTLYTAPMGTTGSTAGLPLGPKAYVYVSASAGVSATQAVLIDINYNVLAATATLAAPTTGFGKQVAIAPVAIPAGGFGWVQVYGRCDMLVVAATAIRSVVSLSGTAGALDDLVAVGSVVVSGIFINAVNGTVGTGMLNWPHMMLDDA